MEKTKTRRLSRTIFAVTLASLSLGGVTACNKSTEEDKMVVFEDSFERSELGDDWNIIVPAFFIKDGRLVGQEVPERKHNTISRVPLAFRNAVFEFSFRLTDGEGLHLVINDENFEAAHAGHICRVSFSPTQVRISDDRDGAFRKDLYQAFIASGRTTERIILAKVIPKTLDPKQWYKSRIILKDDEMEVMIDETLIGSYRSPGIGHPTKTDFGFATVGGTIEMDDVRVTMLSQE